MIKLWYELGKKIGHIDLMLQVNQCPFGCASPHDIEDEYYEIVGLMKKIGIDESLLDDVRIEEFFVEILKQDHPLFTSENTLYFQIGFYFMKIKTILEDELDEMVTDSKMELLENLKEKAKNLKSIRYINNISLDCFYKDVFNKIDVTIYDEISSYSIQLSKSNKNTEIKINTLINNGNVIFGDAINSSFQIEKHFEKIEVEIKNRGGEEQVELEEIFKEIKTLITKMYETHEIPRQRNILEKLSGHLSKHGWFYSTIVDLMGQVILNLINS